MSGVNGTNGVNGVSSVYSATETNATQSSSEIGTIQMVNSDGKTEENIKAEKALENDIKKGNAIYNESNIIGDAIALIFDKNVGNYVVIKGFDKDTTLGEIREKYNLPNGSLRHMVPKGGGNFDTYKVPSNDNGGYVYIYDNDIAEGLGVSTRELKGMFPDKQFSPWYKLGTNE